MMSAEREKTPLSLSSPLLEPLARMASAKLSTRQKDAYRTPPEVYRHLDRRFHFVADMAASDENHLHPSAWFTRERSCLEVSWAEQLERHCGVRRWRRPEEKTAHAAKRTLESYFAPASSKRRWQEAAAAAAAAAAEGGATVPPFVFMNPPYSEPEAFVAKAARECAEGGIGSVVLLKEQDGELWWGEHVAGKAAELVHITGRLAFLHPVYGTPTVGANFGSCLVVYDPRHAPGAPTVATWVARETFYVV